MMGWLGIEDVDVLPVDVRMKRIQPVSSSVNVPVVGLNFSSART